LREGRRSLDGVEALQGLSKKSLIVAEEDSFGIRYRMLWPLPGSIAPEVKPFSILMDVSILALGVAWFVVSAFHQRADRKSSESVTKVE
jgi:hypothetical protein